MNLHHMGYVVRDLDEAARHWYELAGVGPFLVLEHIHFDTLTVGGEPATFDHSAAFAAHGDLFIEIQRIHAAAPAAAAGFFGLGSLPQLHHLAYAVSPAEKPPALPPTVSASTSGLSITQHDLRPSLGFAVEIHTATDEFTALFDRIRAASDGWDRSSHLLPF